MSFFSSSLRSVASRFKPVYAGTTFAALLIATPLAHAATYYMSASAPNTNGNGSSSAPFKETWQVKNVAKPGDVIYVRPGATYTPMFIDFSGAPGKPITFIGDVSLKNPPKVRGTSSRPKAIMVSKAGYITLRGFDSASSNSDVGDAVYIENAHHVTVSDSYLHDSNCTGVGSNKSDYITVENNIVARNTKAAPLQCNAISLYQLKNYDKNSGFHNKIARNWIYDNINLVPTSSGKTSDGNAIIVDDSRHTQNGSTSAPYSGSTVIENNVAFNNGARGAHTYLSDNITIRNNTFYLNNKDPKMGEPTPGEVTILQSGNVKIQNNVLQARSGSKYYGVHVRKSSNVTGEYNLTYGSTAFSQKESSNVYWTSSNRTGNPLFKTPSLDPAVANFYLKNGTPAWNLGLPGISPSVDKKLAPRNTSSGPITAGAYQPLVQ